MKLVNLSFNLRQKINDQEQLILKKEIEKQNQSEYLEE